MFRAVLLSIRRSDRAEESADGFPFIKKGKGVLLRSKSFHVNWTMAAPFTSGECRAGIHTHKGIVGRLGIDRQENQGSSRYRSIG